LEFATLSRAAFVKPALASALQRSLLKLKARRTFGLKSMTAKRATCSMCRMRLRRV
jgi:hypothetical protein